MNKHTRLVAFFLMVFIGLFFFAPGCKKTTTSNDDASSGRFGMISGHITDHSSGAGIYLAHVSTNPPTYTAQTDFFGSYFINAVPAGNYQLIVTAERFITATIHDVSVTGDRNSSIDVVLTPVPTIGTITGRVTDSLNQHALGGVQVFTEPASQTVTTTVFGYYTLADIPADTYNIVAARIGYDTLRVMNFFLPGGRTLARDIMMIPQFGILSGQVTDSLTGTPILGAIVSTSPDTNTVATDSLGFYRIDSLRVDTITVYASKSNYRSRNATNVIIRKNLTTTVNFQLRQ
ncbi:MAG: carboxypeptidase-like regulatory domain-containing protein [bacterium]|nr:carboxypeptidase-like regulatory domain-containing protein [bacterium]